MKDGRDFKIDFYVRSMFIDVALKAQVEKLLRIPVHFSCLNVLGDLIIENFRARGSSGFSRLNRTSEK